MGRPRKYDEDFRQTAFERMKTCQDVSALALELGVNRAQLYRFRTKLWGVPRFRGPSRGFARKVINGSAAVLRSWNAVVARQAPETGFFQRCLAAHRGKSPEARTDSGKAVYEQIRHVDGSKAS